MIIDNLQNSALYENLNPLFKQAFDYLKSLDFSSIEPGKTVLVENKLTVAVSDSNMKTPENAKLEVHDKFIDIQLPVSKAERFGWKERSALKTEREPYNPEKDILFFTDQPETTFDLQPGNFAIFFPEDGHAPCIGEGQIRKIVVKVAVK